MLETCQETGGSKLRRGRGARVAKRKTTKPQSVVKPGMVGGLYKPLTPDDVDRICDTAFQLLEEIGVAGPIPDTLERALDSGGFLNDHERLCFSRAMVEDVISGAAREYTLYGREDQYDLQIGGDRVHFATCGEAVRALDPGSDEYRPSTIADIHDFARLADALEHIHIFAQTVIANELSDDTLLHDINAAYAMLNGTNKHICMAVMDAHSVDAVFQMAHIYAGGEDAFRKRPFFSIGQCPIVSPLKFGEENSEAITRAIQYGAPIEFATVPQSGATGPAALAGNLALSTAETLAALMLVNLVKPGHPVSLGNWPFVSDLRTGAFSGGSGEEAVMMAAASQIINHLDLPSHTAAGMSDAILPDAQSGYEKGITNVLAGQAGCNWISEAAGMLGSLMCCSYEAMVIDNDMLGNVQRTIRGIEVNDETLSYEVIKNTVTGPGHFLGDDQTLKLMETEFLYPDIANRDGFDAWLSQGGKDVRARATEKVTELLATHYPIPFDPDRDEEVRRRFDIRLPASHIQQSGHS